MLLHNNSKKGFYFQIATCENFEQCLKGKGLKTGNLKRVNIVLL